MYKPAANQRIPQRVMDARKQVMSTLLLEAKTCTRCDGAGHLDNKPTWVVVSTTGRKTCFRCWGSGEEMDQQRGPDPLTVRYTIVTQLIPLVEAGNVAMIVKKEAASKRSPYWPILADVFERATSAAAEVAAKDVEEDDRWMDTYGEDEFDRAEREAVWGAYDKF